jgi:hypothetical protein
VNTIEWFINDITDEIIKRNITTTEYNQIFLNWIGDRKFHLDFNGVRYDSLIYRAYKASKKMRVEFKYFEESNMVEIIYYWHLKNQNIEKKKEEEEVSTNSFLSRRKQIFCSLMRIHQDRHKKKLQSLALRGHTFSYFRKIFLVKLFYI